MGSPSPSTLTSKNPKPKKHIGFYTATSLVIANMIGVGVFTSLGFQVLGIHSGFTILVLWIVGGVAALLGSLCYGELGAALPRSGGEYHYLSRIYHPAVGFLSGWLSSTVAFAAPVAASAMALAKYAASVFPDTNEKLLAVTVVLILTFIHSWDMRLGSAFQNISTLLKICFIVFIIVCGLLTGNTGNISFAVTSDGIKEVFTSAFFISLYWVSYAYSGWNASAYIAGEMDEPQKNLPKSLFNGTLFVMVLYVLLNFVFLWTTPVEEMAGKPEVGFVAAKFILGETGGKIIASIITLLLVSSISSMVLAGPRVTQAMGEDVKLLGFFAKKNAKGSPMNAIITQSVISVLFIITTTFEQVITYIGFTLSLSLFFTVLGVYILRYKEPNLPRPYKTWGYPVTPAIFLMITASIIIYGFFEKPVESIAGLATVAMGLVVYYFNSQRTETVE